MREEERKENDCLKSTKEINIVHIILSVTLLAVVGLDYLKGCKA
jgi:hypothetical protein